MSTWKFCNDPVLTTVQVKLNFNCYKLTVHFVHCSFFLYFLELYLENRYLRVCLVYIRIEISRLQYRVYYIEYYMLVQYINIKLDKCRLCPMKMITPFNPAFELPLKYSSKFSKNLSL